MKKFTTLVRYSLVLFLFLSCFPGHVNAQIVAKKVTVSTGHVVPFLQYKPAKHDLTGPNRRYPMIIFLHGGGERSGDTSLVQPTGAVWQLTGYGPLRELGWHNLSFTWDNKTDSFIVLQPLSRMTDTWPIEYINAMIAYGTDSLKADTNRIYLTGHSYGGAGVFNYLNQSSANAKKLAAVAAISAWNTALRTNGSNNASAAKLPLWGFHALDDTITKPDTTIYSINRLNAVNPEVKPLLTLWPAGFIKENAHGDAPDYVYELHLHPYLEDGVINIYEWFLGQNNDSLPNILPVARGGADTIIHSSSGVASLNGSASSDADGHIVRYVWRKISGPAGGTIATPFGTASSTTVSGLSTVGVYKYQLNVVDHRAAIARDTLTITVVDTTADYGKAVSMLTTSSRINAGNVSELISASAFTVEALFKFDSIATDWWNAEATIFRKHVSATDRIKLTVDKATKSVHFTLANGTDVKGYTSSNVISHDTWHHIAASFDGAQTGDSNRIKIYIDGVKQTLTFTGSIPASTSGSSGSCLFGGEPSASQVSVIDEVRLWDTVLTASTINSWKDKLLGSCHPNYNKLTVYWPLDDDSNPASAAAASGTIYPGVITNGSYVNSTLPADTTPCVTYSGKAVSMLTTSSRINAGNVSELISSSAFTVEAQFKYDSTVTGWWDAEATILRKHVTTTDRVKLTVDKATRSVHFTLANGTDVKGYTSSNVVNHNTWHHIAASFDGAQTGDSNRIKIYIDGVKQTLTFTGSIGASTSGSSGSCLFGGEPSASQVSVIDEVRLWDTVLTAATINSWKDKSLGSCHPNFNKLTVYWPLNNDANPASATAALGTIYPGGIVNGAYVGSNQATAGSGCGGARVAGEAPLNKVKDNRAFNGKIYPNPTSGLVQFELNSPVSRSVMVNVIDLSGRYLYRSRSSLVGGSNKISLNITSFPSGTYIIEVADGKTIWEKFKVLKR